MLRWLFCCCLLLLRDFFLFLLAVGFDDVVFSLFDTCSIFFSFRKKERCILSELVLSLF